MKLQNGFTLIELMMTIAIAAILLSVAVPSFTGIIVNNRLSTQTNDLVSDLALARSEAIKRGTRVTVAISSDGSTAKGSGSDWAVGRIVFTDTGTAGTKDGTDEIIRVSSSLGNTNTLTAATFTNTYYVQYRPSGAIDSTGTFTLCHSGYTGRVISISATGRVSTANTSAVCT